MSPEAQAPPTIDVAVVNWNTSAAALAAARAYLASEGVEARVTIVDNYSAPEQRQLLESSRGSFETKCVTKEPRNELRLELLSENAGYGRAANLVLAGGTAELVCVSNADVAPEPGALAAMAAVALADPRAGMVGPVFSGGTSRYHASLPSATTMAGRILAGSFRERPAAEPVAGQTAEVEQPSGACFLVRRPTWEQLGGFDEGFFLWYEDVDLAKRLRDAGYRNLLAGSARVGHAGARSFAQVDPRRQQAIRLDSVRRYIGKHHPRLARTLAPPLLALARRLRVGGTDVP